MAIYKTVKSSCTIPIQELVCVYLVHHKGLDLAFEHLHSCRRDHRAHVRHHHFTQDIADQTVVPVEPSCCSVLHREPIIVIYPNTRREGHMNERTRQTDMFLRCQTISTRYFVQQCASHRQDLQLAGYSCKALLCPDETVSACFPPPEPLRHGF